MSETTGVLPVPVVVVPVEQEEGDDNKAMISSHNNDDDDDDDDERTKTKTGSDHDDNAASSLAGAETTEIETTEIETTIDTETIRTEKELITELRSCSVATEHDKTRLESLHAKLLRLKREFEEDNGIAVAVDVADDDKHESSSYQS
eukprot:scaffold127811_cov61-Attheya_sp.AAC.1